MTRWAVLALPALWACGFDAAGGMAISADDAAVTTPDAAAPIDAPDVERADAGPTRPVHLLLTEVKTNPLANEFIEIYNPGCTPVDLSDYYLTDSQSYPLLPSWGDAPPVLPHQDAVLRFPAGAMLDAQAVAVIARSETGFVAAYTDVPDFALNATLADAMVLVARGDTQDIELVNEGEMIALFTWDGASDLVQDVDLVIAGDAPAAGDGIAAKQAIAPGGVDGPDADAAPTLYLADAASSPDALTRDAGSSATMGAYQRTLGEDGHEVDTGGNGTLGHDETSEDTRATWEQVKNTAPTPGVVPDALRPACVEPGG